MSLKNASAADTVVKIVLAGWFAWDHQATVNDTVSVDRLGRSPAGPWYAHSG